MANGTRRGRGGGRRARRRAAGVTLLELLLVVFLLVVAAGLAVPSFARSFRGARLRASARTVVMASRYARAMAVLRQQYVAVLFYRASGRVEVVGLEAAAGPAEQSRYLDERPRAEPSAAGEAERDGAAYQVAAQLSRYLAPGVRFKDVRIEGGEAQEHQGTFWVNYYPNGMCQPHTVRLADERGQEATVEVEAFSGRVKVAYGR